MTTQTPAALSAAVPGFERKGRIAYGCIADDYTGGTDVASAFRRVGLRTVLLFGPPTDETEIPDCDAVVVSLKTRNLPAQEAVRLSLETRAWLVDLGVDHVYFKYCSTFDSTDAGNIGVVADALIDASDATITVICPTSPEHGRTVYQGYLFVGDRLLSESPMKDHPLTPMRDSNLVRVLGRQTPHRVALVPHETVRQGSSAVAATLQRLGASGVRYAVVDAVSDRDLETVAAASASLPVLTGAAGLARSLGGLLGATVQDEHQIRELPDGPTLILAGSCSDTTLRQVTRATRTIPALQLDPGKSTIDDLRRVAMSWIDNHLDGDALLVYSSSTPAERAAHGVDGASEALEELFADLARHAHGAGVRRVVVAGGETSGSVVAGLDVHTAAVAFEEDIGVPWIVAGDDDLWLLLKSGNFGGDDLFPRAAARRVG